MDLHEFYNINSNHLAPHSLNSHQDQTRCFLLVRSHPSSASFADTAPESYTEHHTIHQPSFTNIAVTIRKVAIDKPAIVLDLSHLSLLAYH